MPLFQVQLKKGTKTITENVEANDYKDVLEYYYKLSTCEVIEIREWLEKKNTIKKDDGDYIDSVSIVIKNNFKDSSRFRLPKVKRNISDKDLDNIIQTSLTVENKKPILILKTYNL